MQHMSGGNIGWWVAINTTWPKAKEHNPHLGAKGTLCWVGSYFSTNIYLLAIMGGQVQVTTDWSRYSFFMGGYKNYLGYNTLN